MNAARRGLLPLLLAVSGCLGAPPGALPGIENAPAPLAFAPAVSVSTESPSAEPVVAVASDGTLFFEGVGFDDRSAAGTVNKAFRSRDGGATWEDVTPPLLGTEGAFDGFVAVGNGDRVYLANSAATVLAIYRSDDLGETWNLLAVPPVPTPMHRMWLVPEGDATLHVAVEKLSVAPPFEFWHVRSDDRGQTWGPPVLVSAFAQDFNTAFGSNLALDPSSGRLYWARLLYDTTTSAPAATTLGEWFLMTSGDRGLTWERKPMFRLDSPLTTSWQSLAVDPAGTVYMAWAQERNGTSVALYARSRDAGTTWSVPQPVSPSKGTQTLVWIDPAAEGRIGAAWYAADVAGVPGEVRAPWFVDAAVLTGADTPAPLRQQGRITPQPIHEGNVCTEGPFCRPPKDRSLLDYPWIEHGADGTAHYAFASTSWERDSAFGVYSRSVPGAPASG